MPKSRIATAGKELLKMNFGNAVKSLVLPQSQWMSSIFGPEDYRGADAKWMFLSDGSEYAFSYSGRNSSLRAFENCPPLTAIINRKAQARINGKIFVMNSKGKEAEGLAATKIRKLLQKPNPLQSGKQFRAQTYIYQQIFGFALILPIIPVGYQQYGPIEATSLWNIPPWMLDIQESDDLYYSKGFQLFKSITLNYKQSRIVLDPKALHVIKDITPSFETLILPESRTRSLRMPINNIIGALESENIIINKRGPDIMISAEKDKHGVVPISPDERTLLESEFKRYGLRKQQSRAIFTNAATKITNLTYNIKEMLLHESIQKNTQHICDGYNYPPHLLGLIDPTFNNQNAAEKGLYNNAIIPEAESDDEQMNQIFRTEEYNIRITTDFSEIPVLQEERVQQITAEKLKTETLKMQFDMGLITLNECLVGLDKDPIGPEGDIKSTDTNNAGVPLATIIGVGGVQGIIQVLTASGMSAEARQAALEIVFGLSPTDAARMAGPDAADTSTTTPTTTATNDTTAIAAETTIQQNGTN